MTSRETKSETRRAAAALGAAAFALALLGGACNIEPASPSNPTFERDVKPILESHCIRCHGNPPYGEVGGPPPAGSGLPTKAHVDFTSLEDSPPGCSMDGGISDPGCTFGARSLSALMASAVQPAAGALRMPPAPSPFLTKSEIDTIVHWAASPQ